MENTPNWFLDALKAAGEIKTILGLLAFLGVLITIVAFRKNLRFKIAVLVIGALLVLAAIAGWVSPKRGEDGAETHKLVIAHPLYFTFSENGRDRAYLIWSVDWGVKGPSDRNSTVTVVVVNNVGTVVSQPQIYRDPEPFRQYLVKTESPAIKDRLADYFASAGWQFLSRQSLTADVWLLSDSVYSSDAEGLRVELRDAQGNALCSTSYLPPGKRGNPVEPTPNHDKTADSGDSSSRRLGPVGGISRWTNSLGMVFVPVTGAKVLFSIWDTRQQDYRQFLEATFRSSRNSGFAERPAFPIVNVNWQEAKTFCNWLTQKETKAGLLNDGQTYRLPTDEEWSIAVGLRKESGTTPREKDMGVKGVYPWGSQWPPPRGTGNYRGKEVDEFPEASPVGSFAPNQYGLYDMGGNVWQWCDDVLPEGDDSRVLRGAGWDSEFNSGNLLSSRRNIVVKTIRAHHVGFRCVLVVDQ